MIRRRLNNTEPAEIINGLALGFAIDICDPSTIGERGMIASWLMAAPLKNQELRDFVVKS